MKTYNWEGVNPDGYFLDKLEPIPSALPSFQKLFQVSATARSEERFSRNAETDLVCRLLLEKKKKKIDNRYWLNAISVRKKRAIENRLSTYFSQIKDETGKANLPTTSLTDL